MGNLCSIFHARFRNLIKIVPNAREAQLLDYILLGWQTSKYKLKGSEKKWFMKSYNEIVAETGIPRSTVERYIKNMDNNGLLERKQALYSRTTEKGEFQVKKGCYINITDKLLVLLKSDNNQSIATPEYVPEANDTIPENQDKNTESGQPDCAKINNNEVIDHLKMRGLYIRDLYSSFNNTISKNLLTSVNKPELQRLINQFESIQSLLFTEIKEEIPEPVKKLVLGTFFNLTFTHRKSFSSPKQIAAEYLYSLINTEFYMPDVTCFKFRNNILSKMIRDNRWLTPKGFYKHFYLGQQFKDKQELREKAWQEEKEKEISGCFDADSLQFEKDERLIQIESAMYEKSKLIELLNEELYKAESEEIILQVREKIQQARKEIEALWSEQFKIENELESQRGFNDLKFCA